MGDLGAMLHVTNGDVAAGVLRAAGMEGDILPWRDVLHEGPVRADLPLEELSKLRARFIAEAGWAKRELAESQLAQRDAMLRGAGRRAEVVLWFEHDLYDQLQLVQLLAWFAVHEHPRITLVCEAEYIGSMTPARAADLFRSRAEVRRPDLQAALAAWAAFGSDEPFGLQRRSFATANLRFLPAALRRLLEEYPWTSDGLSRLERQVLAPLRLAPCGFGRILQTVQAQEDPVFLGDTVLEWHLRRMASDGLVGEGPQWRLTAHGHQVLEGKADAWQRARAPRWLGGVQVTRGEPRWDAAAARLVAGGR